MAKKPVVDHLANAKVIHTALLKAGTMPLAMIDSKVGEMQASALISIAESLQAIAESLKRADA